MYIFKEYQSKVLVHLVKISRRFRNNSPFGEIASSHTQQSLSLLEIKEEKLLLTKTYVPKLLAPLCLLLCITSLCQ